MWCCPSYASEDSVSVRNPAGCGGCSHRAAHNIAERLLQVTPFGAPRYSLIPLEERQDTESMHRIGAALFLWSYTLWGYIGNSTPYNAGEAGDNASQFQVYQITGAGEDSLTLRGRNPKSLMFGASRLNPEWPLPDPETGELGRLVWTNRPGVMPPCAASVEFVYPSCLCEGIIPLVIRVECDSDEIDDVTFTLHFAPGTNLMMAMEPFDLAYPPGAEGYRCVVRFEFLQPQIYRDYQAPDETTFSPVRRVLTGAVVHELLDSEDQSTRVLFPSMAPGVFTFTLMPDNVAVDLTTRLITNKVAGGYETLLNLTGLTFDKAIVNYYAESTASDTMRVPVPGQCSKSRLDPTGSYIHGDTQHCGDTDSSGFQDELYHERCWLPGKCDGFSLQDESTMTMGDHALLGSLWHRAGWVLEQQIEGYSATWNFRLYNRGGASIEGFAGSFCDQVSGGKFPRRTELFQRTMGKRLVYETEDGDQKHTTLHGAFYLSSYQWGTSSYNPDASDIAGAQIGIVAERVEDWEDDKPEGLNGFPHRYVGGTNVYSYQSWSGDSLARVNTSCPSESYVVAVSMTEVAAAELVSRLQAIY